MPTNQDFNELIENCTYTWVKYKEIWGGLITSKINGNWIFFPSSESYNYHYWSASSYMDSEIHRALALELYPFGLNTGLSVRYGGNPIRPVTD